MGWVAGWVVGWVAGWVVGWVAGWVVREPLVVDAGGSDATLAGSRPSESTKIYQNFNYKRIM